MSQAQGPGSGGAAYLRLRRELDSDDVVRERFESCQGLVRALAWKIHKKLPPYVELEDLIQYGQQGLLEASAKFDSSRNIKFVTFAHHRIRGAILDGVSKFSWFRYSAYHGSRYEALADDLLELEGSDEAAGSSPADDARWFTGATGSLGIIYLATTGRDADGLGPVVEDLECPRPDSAAIEEEVRERLHELIGALPADAGELIRGIYFEGLSIKEAGERLGISKAWASRLHAKTLKRLERALRSLGISGS